jgi:hypothetical protein
LYSHLLRLLVLVPLRSGRYIIDRDDIKVQVTSLWPHGHCGVADVPPEAGSNAEENIAVACDMGLAVEWRATVYLPGSSSVLGSVLGKVKVSGIRLNPDGRVTCEPELLLMVGLCRLNQVDP